ncbi:PREDICTED: protein SMG7-like [Tarenaya hassleriana]|uniref:protein SMG7-like n=1 Tax=Tarenaya hassleriana TaxID=28532 RepID=UPI00053C0B95|nr:PREDICTED: protein SMG7-like [Tarenaya hassleriana]XP_010519797.1 PREDICTED: protein SMG7-like [Tarenaya hassleriana]XP_010519798.1 PREDICTED: protein SMG7-like [Tarenaya hassleriana]
MMIGQMDKTSDLSSRERAQSILDKTVKLESKRRKAAQARLPSDPNAWQQIRENYEAIILEDHTFSEQHSIEYNLWQLHYKRIEEFRAHFNVLSSGSSNTAQNVKGPIRPDRVAKLRLQFKTFLSEAAGFYHDLILKIRSKYGLPMGYFSEDPEKSAEVKKAFVSCHRCLIYLGDLARYKGLYGEGDSKNREYAAASSYYLQAASLLPASGNPHHQLAIISSYSGDELAAVYRYFRSLAVESPFPTARDNLIVAFEKNRQNYTQLLMMVKDSSRKPNGKGRRKGEDLSLKDANLVVGPEKDIIPNANEMLKTFCTRFVRLNGIIFTRTSLEMFSEVLDSTINSLQELLSSGPAEELNFGADVTDNAVFIVRLVAILIFSVHNSKKETASQTYAEIVQGAVLAKNSLTACFKLLGLVVDRCVQLREPSSSYFLPGVLVFVEWLACYPDIAAGSDPDEKQIAVRSNFWNQCIAFLNRILSLGPMLIDAEEDETCFSNMSRYDERETENRLALFEDCELRGFLPLLPAQAVLDFTRNHSFGSEGPKEKKARIKRILAAGKALTSVIKIDQNPVYFDSKKKEFLVGVKPSDNFLLDSYPSLPDANNTLQDHQMIMDLNSSVMQQGHPYLDEEDEDEVIVFKPMVSEKRIGAPDQIYEPNVSIRKPDQGASIGDLKSLGGSRSASHDNLLVQASASTSFQLPVSVVGSNLLAHLQPAQSQVQHLQQCQTQVMPQLPAQSQVGHLQPTQSQIAHFPLSHLQACKRLPEDAASLAGNLSGLNLIGNGHMMNEMQGNHGISYHPAPSLPIHQSFNVNSISGVPYPQSRATEAVLMSKVDAVSSSGVIADGMGVHTSLTRKNPISRPVRHLGPPPGFNSIPSKAPKELMSSSDLSGSNPLVDDYRWLDGYQPQSTRGVGLSNSLNYPLPGKSEYVSISNGLNGTVNFPFPGKQVPTSQVQADIQKGWQAYQQLQQQQLVNGNQQSSAQLPEQYQGQSSWPGRSFV